MNKEAKEHVQVELSVHDQRRPWPEPTSKSAGTARPELATIPVAMAKKVVRLKGQTDASKIEDQGISRVLCLRNKGAGNVLQLYAPWSPDIVYTLSLDRLRIFNPFDVTALPVSSPRAVGRQRTLIDLRPLAHVSHTASHGMISLGDVDGTLHRVQLQMSPRSESVARILRMILFVLPSWLGDHFLRIWWDRMQAFQGDGDELHALYLTIFSMALALDDNSSSRRRSEAAPKGSPSKSRKASVVSQDTLQLMLRREAERGSENVLQSSAWSWTQSPLAPVIEHDDSLAGFISEARDFLRSKAGQDVSSPLRASPELVRLALSRMIASLHLLREESKLDVTSAMQGSSNANTVQLAYIIAQLGQWMGWDAWDWNEGHYYGVESLSHAGFEDFPIRACTGLAHPFSTQEPPSFFAWLERAILPGFAVPFPSLDAVLNVPLSPHLQDVCERLFPRITALSKYLLVLHAPGLSPQKQVEAIAESAISARMLETFPSSIVAVLKDAIAQCQAAPPTTWSPALLDLINRDDLTLLASGDHPREQESAAKYVSTIQTLPVLMLISIRFIQPCGMRRMSRSTQKCR